MSDFIDQVHLLLTTAWKPFLLCLAALVTATWFISSKFYDREIATLRTERDSARSEVSELKAKAKTGQPTSAAPADDEGPLVWFANISMEGGPLTGRNVFALTIFGQNKSAGPVKLKTAKLVSGVDGTAVDLEILAGDELLSLDRVGLIPSRAPIRLIAKFGPPDPKAPGKILGLEPKAFAEKWRNFTFKAEDEKRTYEFPVSEDLMATFLPSIVGPRVTKISPQ
ncbi:hypothetical protein SAMN05216374_1006 [Tardiphaga sp. OK246]|uniref:hypothetical protein n=1 Tax=Tardiphaga sp. OK246 TaxID=1855307 RepID=UPI000B733A01|nr:hypothetical protein [Tardiphaga sp. OK246]SNS36869.1 hypothetical protein SAMN05216374_1006 [Tardiphaga sp. OK246]